MYLLIRKILRRKISEKVQTRCYYDSLQELGGIFKFNLRNGMKSLNIVTTTYLERLFT